jgi:hypothetical protein
MMIALDISKRLIAINRIGYINQVHERFEITNCWNRSTLKEIT